MKELLKQTFAHFLNKPCTITTVQVNWRFNVEQMMDYFSGMLVNIDENGIWLEHFKTKCKTYILLQHVVSITEEQVLYEDNPEHAKIIEEYRKEKPLTAERTAINKSPFVNPNAMALMAKQGHELKKSAP